MTDTPTVAPTTEPSTPSESFDYATLIAQEGTPAQPPLSRSPARDESPAPETTATVEADETAADEKADEKVEAAAETTAEPKPGTADKAVQKLQQKVASFDQRLDDILSKIEAKGGKASSAEVAKLQEIKAERDEVAALLELNDEDYIDAKGIKHVARRVLESEKGRNDDRAVLATLREEVQALKAERIWDGESKKFEGVDVRKVWSDAAKDATTEVEKELTAGNVKVSGEIQNQLSYARTLSLYAKRCDEASKSVRAKSGTKETPQTARAAPPRTTPGGARVTTDSRSPSAVAANPHEITLADYRNLVQPD